jgi:hypothetical protein
MCNYEPKNQAISQLLNPCKALEHARRQRRDLVVGKTPAQAHAESGAAASRVLAVPRKHMPHRRASFPRCCVCVHERL